MKKTNSVLLSTPYLLWMAAFTLVPLGVVGYYALTDPSTGVFTLGNVRNLGMYLPVLWKSIAYSFVSAMICLLLGYPVAYYIAHCSETAQKFLYMLIMLPMCMSFLLRTLAWVGLLQDTGIINSLLAKIGLPTLRLIRTPGAVVLGMVYNYLPFMVIPLYSIMTKIEPYTLEAAGDLGANPWNTFTRVVLPLSAPGITTGITMVFVPSVSTFIISRMLGGGSNMMVGDLIETQFLGNAYNPNLGSAISLVLMVFILLVMSLMNQFEDNDDRGGMLI